LVAVEIEEGTGDAVSKAAVKAGFEAIAVRQDLTGRDRVVAGRRPPLS
jgi:methylase of polypeptide subunit release factors